MDRKEAEEFIINVIEEATGIKIDHNNMLFEEEILDSVNILYLISEIEEKYHIELPLEEVVEENYKNLNAILTYILTKK